MENDLFKAVKTEEKKDFDPTDLFSNLPKREEKKAEETFEPLKLISATKNTVTIEIPCKLVKKTLKDKKTSKEVEYYVLYETPYKTGSKIQLENGSTLKLELKVKPA